MSDTWKIEVSGRFSKEEDETIRTSYGTRSAAEIARDLRRATKSVENRVTKLGLRSPQKKPNLTKSQHREAYVATLTDDERKEFFGKEVRASSRYRSVIDAFSDHERDYYIEKYVEFMMDPTIETMTAMEKDTLHQMLLAEIQIQRYMREEKQHSDILADWDGQGPPPPPFSRAREIKDCQDVIMKCQKSLMVERAQRLKDQSDQSVTFTNLIKEMKDPRNRHTLGNEAAMLKLIAEQTFNSKLGTNIVSGSDRKFDLARNFVDGEVPELPTEFLPPVEENE